MSDILPKNFTVYRSSAGSGKTYTLVKEYLKIILVEPAKFRNILAITFTIKAANEMKDRILENLHELSEYSIKSNSGKIKGLLDSLVVETGLTQKEIIATSRNALSLILHNYSDFSISTIDSFVHRVIRSFALDLDLSMNFEVEMDTDELISKCIDLLLDKTGNDKELTKVLLNYIKYKSLEDRSLDIDYDLNKFAKTLNKEVVQCYLEDFRKLKPEDFESVTKKTRDFIRQFETYISNIASEACKSISNKEISPSSFFQARSGIAVYFKRLSENNFDKLQPNKNVKKTIEEDKWTSAKATQEDRIKIEDIKGELMSAYGNIKGRMDSDFSRYETYKLLNRNIYLLAVLNLIEKVIDEFKKQNNLVLISEFNKKISEIVFSEPVPFIYERLGERYKHFFIDEFQDTSVLQWMNLLPLLDNSLAEGNFNMVVGDGKQAIYRFRNGEIEQFVRLPKLVDKTNNPINLEREQSLERNFLGLELKKNYRSRQNVVEFNNDLFTYISETILPQDCREVYQNPRQEINKEKHGGFVSIYFLEKDKDAEVPFEDATHNRILEIIYRQIELGFEYKDIAILCRGNKESSYIANYLAKNAIPVVSSESLLLAYSPSVSFLIACMKLIHDQHNGILLEEIKRFLSNKKRREEVAGEEEVAGAVKEMDLFDRVTLSRLSKFPVYDLCEELISIFDLNDEIDPYIHYFLDKVFEFTSKHNTATVDFIDWWEDKKEKLSLVIPEETNAVRIMTIHKAKGLEFPVVIFPYANEKLKISENIFWISNEDENISKLPFLMLPAIKGALEKTDYYPYYQNEENKSFLDLTNVLYVVMTRAVDSLYVISEKPKDKETVEDSDKSKVHFMLSAFLMHSGIWSDEQINYSFGEETLQSAESDVVRQKPYKLEKAISRDWRKHALISKRAPEIWDIDDPNRNRQWGNLVHTVLSKIKYLEDKDTVLDKFYLEGYFDKDEKKKLSGKIDKVFNNQLVRLFFTKGVEIKNEAEILLPDGKSYRPDRIVLDGKKAVVIDYKTGKSSEYHKKQLDNYASLLIDMGYEVDKKYLIYIDDEVEVVEV